MTRDADGETAALYQHYATRNLSTSPDGPLCPPGVHSMFDFCPGGCLNEEVVVGPCGCPCDACTNYCEQLDCE